MAYLVDTSHELTNPTVVKAVAADSGFKAAAQRLAALKDLLESDNPAVADAAAEQIPALAAKVMSVVRARNDAQEHLDKALSAPVPGGPVTRAPQHRTPKTDTQAELWRAKAASVGDPTLRAGYIEMAARLEKAKK